jgi:hypothetical protein
LFLVFPRFSIQFKSKQFERFSLSQQSCGKGFDRQIVHGFLLGRHPKISFDWVPLSSTWIIGRVMIITQDDHVKEKRRSRNNELIDYISAPNPICNNTN